MAADLDLACPVSAQRDPSPNTRSLHDPFFSAVKSETETSEYATRAFFSSNTGAGMFVVGGDGLATLRGWLKHSAGAPGQEAYADDLAAVRTSLPILSLQDVEQKEALERLFALPTLTRARSVTVSKDGPDGLLVRYRAIDTAASASDSRQARLSTPRVGDAPPG